MRLFVPVAVTIAVIGVTQAVPSAHHSFAAEFDAQKPVRIAGTLAKIEWTNPHSYFYVDVKDDGGAVIRWGCEAGSPGALSRRGFKRGDLKLGDSIVVDGYLARDGSHFMDARRVTLPDGRIVSGASAGDGGPEVRETAK
ncbi:MAG TPA: DUF6152 family protein, partial [Vicinamibacterales bacterium]|nr:DUF6152 family protein [Vicinamibacterales bacterium]